MTVLLWLMPLGYFIKPSQEKTACDGQRPFHMCSMMKSSGSGIQFTGKLTVQPNAGDVKTAKSSSASGDDFLLMTKKKLLLKSIAGLRVHQSDLLLFQSAVLRPIDHPPRVISL